MLTPYSLPPALLKISGALGKKIVVKQCSNKQVVTRYPNMGGIVATQEQKGNRRLFARAVRYAQSFYWKPELKAEWKRKLRRPRRLFQALMKQYYRQLRQREEKRESRILKWSHHVVAHRDLMWMFTPTPPFLAYASGNRRKCSEGQPSLHTERQAVWKIHTFPIAS